MTGRLKFIQMSMVGRHLKYAALPNIAITTEARKACFISFKLIPEFLFVIMRVSGVLLVESLSV